MSLFSAFARLLHPHPLPDAVVLAAIERLVDLVDPALRNARGYVRMLEAPVHYALGYCAGLVSTLPGPVAIDHHAFASDKLVHALFATASDIGLMLGESQSLRDYLAEPASYDSDELYALLAARRCTKRVLGYAIEGDNVRSDVPQELLYFTAHTLVETGSNLDAIRGCLRAAAFASLGKSFRTHVDALRQEKCGLQGERSLAQAHLTVLRGKTDRDEQYVVHTRRIAELDASLRDAVESLMPEQLLEALASNLKQPEQLLRLEPIVLTVDRAGVLTNAMGAASSWDSGGSGASGTSVNSVNSDLSESSYAAKNEAQDELTLQLFELTSRDRRRNVTLLVRIRREDAVASVEAAKVRRDRFLVI